MDIFKETYEVVKKEECSEENFHILVFLYEQLPSKKDILNYVYDTKELIVKKTPECVSCITVSLIKFRRTKLRKYF